MKKRFEIKKPGQSPVLLNEGTAEEIELVVHWDDEDDIFGVFSSEGVKVLSQKEEDLEALVSLKEGAYFRLNTKKVSTWYKWTGEEWDVEVPESSPEHWPSRMGGRLY